MTEAACRRLDQGLEDLGLSARLADPLATYLSELLSWNARMNLIGPTDETDAVAKHLLDSLAAVPILEERMRDGATVADLGSGGGLPGIPLALAFPQARVTLIERSEKKCRFLFHAVELLGLSTVSVVSRDLRELKTRFDLITLRAVSGLNPSHLELLLAHLRPAGAAALYKARGETVEAELKSVRKVVRRRRLAVETYPLDVPFLDAERRLVVIAAP
jgi:16S rRNA (guanine527-N7)-methyltransferase